MADEKDTQLTQIEHELTDLLVTDRKAWAKSYLLMNRVQDEKLYEGKYRSFTQWMNALAEQTHYNVSTLWARFNAGRTYADYSERMNLIGKTTPKVTDLDISPDSITIVGKIAKADKNLADNLMPKVLNKELSRADVRQAFYQIRQQKHNRALAASSIPDTERKILEEEAGKDVVALLDTSKVTAGEMCETYEHSTSWFAPTRPHRVRDVYFTAEELPVYSGTTRKARRMDICAFTNIDQKSSATNKLTIHCIENKVDKNDLLNDHKMAEYVPYCDYFWLSVTPDLVDVAKDYIADGWGLLSVDRKRNITTIIKAKKHDCLFRDETYSQALSKIALKKHHIEY
ncbi:hypothetical protein LMB68_11085 [Limosilactobacillus reuteri]|uniref:hypothetical protein n=1 Tax=Limosilactobacillus reuteri TaxID=1598 RepID=UPI001E5BECA2|nr:hypothetical protein [Limosilactobacillus reuteri]MCC4414868.1 hypothetical protein [Limosilactobacillus reuteri]